MICTKRIKVKNFEETEGNFLKNQRVRIFSEAELGKASNNYADDRKLGEGDFGSIYSGVLTYIKWLLSRSPKGWTKLR